MLNISEIDFEKGQGLIPAIIQDSKTKQVLMLGYMNKESLEVSIQTNLVTFFSRTKNRLWTKGEESGNTLNIEQIKLDCDKDTLLIQVKPNGNTCHLDTKTCWGEEASSAFGIIDYLENEIETKLSNEIEGSYISSLKNKGLAKIAQKVGEEAVEVVIEAMGSNEELFLSESADLFFHYLILLRAKETNLDSVLKVLEARIKK
jgi:phosphoribosyl-AMP cyclohydrolase / phosphoribosyl-ATP pyrophosphohydrolase